MAKEGHEGQNDPWSSNAYNAAASFVPKLTSKVLSYLSPNPGDLILDIGCGDGALTAQIAAALGGRGAVHGLDASPAMIAAARAAHPQTLFQQHDCTRLATHLDGRALRGAYDKVFSNAALHWILRDPSTRTAVLTDVAAALRPGGQFVFEAGGAGNVAEVHAALVGALARSGMAVVEAHAASPWLFPSEGWMRGALEAAGLEVLVLEAEYRPTRLTAETVDGKGGMEGWVRLMGARFLERLPEGERDEAVRWVLEVLEGICRREDGSWWIGYVRLRGVAVKKLDAPDGEDS